MTPKGTLLIIGGAEDKGDESNLAMGQKNNEFEQFEILKELIPHGTARKRIEIITTASSIPGEMEKSYTAAFRKIGFRDVGFIKIENKIEARNPEYIQRIEDSHAVLFSGGDQFKLSATLGGTDTTKAIHNKYYEDKDFVLAGTSAGAMVMSKMMIYEGGVNEALLKTDLKLTAGLGFFDTCIIDTHFIKRGRFGRLAHAIVMNPEALGVGLGEDTMFIIKKGFEAECRGSGMIVIIDGQEIGQTNIVEVDDDTPIFVEDLKVHLLSKGCRFSIAERKVAEPAIAKPKRKERA